MNVKQLDIITYVATGTSIVSFLDGANALLMFVASLIAIVSGIIGIVVKIKIMMSDGKIDEKEAKERLANEIKENDRND